MKTNENLKKRHINRKLVALIISVFLVLVLVEIYAHFYVRMHNLPVLTREEALKLVPCYDGSCTFSSSGARWFVVWKIKRPTSSINFAYIYLFKIKQNKTLLIQNVDVTILGLKATSNGTGNLYANIDDTFYKSNYTIVRIRYDLGEIGMYQIDFGLLVKIYEETIFGFLPKEETRIPIKVTVYYGP